MAARSGAVVVATALAGGLAGAVAAGTLGGTAVLRQEGIGRYQMVAHGSGLIRLDTATGEMVGCLVSRASWPGVACAVDPDTFDMSARSFRVQAVQADIAAGLARDTAGK